MIQLQNLEGRQSLLFFLVGIMKNLLEAFLNSMYGIFIFVWLFSGVMFVSRTMHNSAFKSRSHKINFILSGIGSSILIGWLACEVAMYFGLSKNLGGAVGGLAGYIGANTISDLFLQYLRFKIFKDEKKEKEKNERF